MQINVFISLHILLKPLRSLPEKFGFSYFFYILLYHNILFHCNGKRFKLHPGVILKKRLLPYDMQVEVSRNKCLRLMLYIFVKSHPNVMFSFISVGFFFTLHEVIQNLDGNCLCTADVYFFCGKFCENFNVTITNECTRHHI